MALNAPARPKGGPRKFVAPTKAQCLSQVRQAMGDSAVILSSRTIQQRWFLGLLTRKQVEVTASDGLRKARRRAAMPDTASSNAPGYGLLNNPSTTGVICVGIVDQVRDLRRLVEELASQVRQSGSPDIPKPFFDLYTTLRQHGVAESVVRDLVLSAAKGVDAQQVTDPGEARRLVCGQIAKSLKTGGAVGRRTGSRPHIVAMIGPTGVGKTTTIAKLAANLKLREERKVGLITIDTYRIAAIDQLKKYAQIISAPLCVVSSPAQIRAAIREMADHDYILIDTAGRSPRDMVKLSELGSFLTAAQPDEVHLVLSAVCSTNSTVLAMERFSGLRVDRMIFTKLDEAQDVGSLLNVASQSGIPLSYLTHGQDVPNDIDVASAQKLAMLLTERPARPTAAA